MKASDFNAVISCPHCGGDGQNCPFCDNGEFSHYCPANPSEADRDVLVYAVESDADGRAKKMLSAQRVNTLAGDATKDPPTDGSGDLAVPQDIADRMQNQLGVNAPYEVNGNSVTESDLPNGWPSDADLSPQEVIAWLKARGNTTLAGSLHEAIENLGL
jgi:hypothetical protein